MMFRRIKRISYPSSSSFDLSPKLTQLGLPQMKGENSLVGVKGLVDYISPSLCLDLGMGHINRG